MHRNRVQFLLLMLLFATLASCGSNKAKDGPPRSGSTSMRELPDDAVPRREPRSKHGNGPVYEVFGQRYTVMESSSGYRERGVASWYGNKFHGKLTSNQERYDMHAMTAAHKTLPLPSYVRVRNLSNNRSVVVRVNDRGPFVPNRVIDLSYSAALKLDMVKDGTSLVEVEVINFDPPSGNRPTRQTTATTAQKTEPVPVSSNRIYVQAGAFGTRDNAERRLTALRSRGIVASFVLEDTGSSPTLYRVRIGPIKSVEQYDIIVEELDILGISDPYLVTE